MKSKLLAEEIIKSIDKIDPELRYREFADAVAIVIKEEYGKHLENKFITQLIYLFDDVYTDKK